MIYYAHNDMLYGWICLKNNFVKANVRCGFHNIRQHQEHRRRYRILLDDNMQHYNDNMQRYLNQQPELQDHHN